MGMIGRLAAAWADASFAVIAALAWLSASLISCPQVSVLHSVSMTGVEINAAIPSSGPITFSIDDDYRNFGEDDFVEDDFRPRVLAGVRLVSPPSLTLSQSTPPQSLSLSLLAPAQRPLRC
jgi:hypothetical protein